MNKELLFKILSTPPSGITYNYLEYAFPSCTFFVAPGDKPNHFVIEMNKPSQWVKEIELDETDYHMCKALFLSAKNDIINHDINTITNYFSEDSEVQVREVTPIQGN